MRRRAWADPRVRFWWLVAAVVLASALYLFVSRFVVWHADRDLIVSGVRVDATVLDADGMVIKGHTEFGDVPVHLQYEYQGTVYSPVVPYLEGRRHEDSLIVGSTIPIRVDPANPARWTPRLSAAPLSQEWVGATITLAAGIALLLGSVWIHGGVLRTWRDGRRVDALVLDARHTALVPRGWNVRCTPADPADKRVYNVFAPANADVVQGATIALLMPAASGGRPLAAGWFN